MHIDDAIAFIIDYICKPRDAREYSSYGYGFYLPNVIVAYIMEIEHSREPLTFLYNSPRARELSPICYEAAWDLCRRGVLRPGIKSLGEQATPDGASGNGYCLTTFGRQWIEQGASALIMTETGRLGELFEKLSKRLGPGFLQRANEAVVCHRFGVYLSCCAMCGAAAESILLSAAIMNSMNEEATLKIYRAANGRRSVIESIVGQAPRGIADPFRSATGLLSYWRDDAAHGLK